MLVHIKLYWHLIDLVLIMAFRVGRTDVIICDEIKGQKGYTLTQ